MIGPGFAAALPIRLWAWGGAAALLLGLGAAGAWKLQSTRIGLKDAQIGQLNSSLKSLTEARDRDRATLALVQAQKAAVRRSGASAQASLNTAPAPWADAALPKEVVDALDPK